MSQKVVIFAFNGEASCFAHALLNAQDLFEKGYDAKLVIEGSATGLLPELVKPSNPFNDAYATVKGLGLIDAVCRACATKMGSVAVAESEGLPLVGTMSGHPPMETYIKAGYRIITI